MRLAPGVLDDENETILGRIGVNIDYGALADARRRRPTLEFRVYLYAASLGSDSRRRALLGGVEEPPGKKLFDGLEADSVNVRSVSAEALLGEKLLADRWTSGDLVLVQKSSRLLERVHRAVLGVRRVDGLKADEEIPG